jgi:hypothetical protein
MRYSRTSVQAVPGIERRTADKNSAPHNRDLRGPKAEGVAQSRSGVAHQERALAALA